MMNVTGALLCSLSSFLFPSFLSSALAASSLADVLDSAAGVIPPRLRETLAGKPSPWIVKAYDVGEPTDVHKDIPWHLLDKEKDPRFNLPNRGRLGLFNPNADIDWLIGIGSDQRDISLDPPRRYTDHLVNLAAQEIDLAELKVDVLFLPVTSDTVVTIVEFRNSGTHARSARVQAIAAKPSGENRPAIDEPAAAWSGPTGRYGYGITVTSGRMVAPDVYEEWDSKRTQVIGSLRCTTGADHPASPQPGTYELPVAPGGRATLMLALNLHRYGPKPIETRNQILLYPAETDEQARMYGRDAVDQALRVDWASLVRESYRWYERVPLVEMPAASWTADFCCALELPRGNTWSPQGVLGKPWYTFCRVNGHEPYGWWSYGMHAHEHLSTQVVNIGTPGLSQAYLRGHFQVQQADGCIQYGVNPSGKNFHEPLATAPLLAAEAWAAYGWSGDRQFLAEAYAAASKSVRWWRSPARTRPGAALQHWYDFIETVRDDKDLATWTATDGAERQEALDLNCYLLNEERTLATMARELDRADEARHWQADADARTARMRESLWHAEDGVFYGRDLASGRWARVMDISTFLPLWAHLATPEQADSIVRLLGDPTAFGTDYPVATLAVRHMPEKLRGQYHWRGANWVEMTWPVIQGLRDCGRFEEAARLAEANCRMVFRTLESTGHFREFYNSLTGEPSDLTDYIWTSMPAIMIVETFFGLRPLAEGLEIMPTLPAGWNEIRMENLRVRHATISIHLRRNGLSQTSVHVNGKDYEIRKTRGALVPWADLPNQCTIETTP